MRSPSFDQQALHVLKHNFPPGPPFLSLLYPFSFRGGETPDILIVATLIYTREMSLNVPVGCEHSASLWKWLGLTVMAVHRSSRLLFLQYQL